METEPTVGRAVDASCSVPPSSRVSPAIFLHLRSLARGYSAPSLGPRLRRSWQSWDEVVTRSAHAAARLHSTGWVIAQRRATLPAELMGGFFFSVRLQRDGGRLAQHLTVSMDPAPTLSPALLECWAAQAGAAISPQSMRYAAESAEAAQAPSDTRTHFSDHWQVDSSSASELAPSLKLPMQAAGDTMPMERPSQRLFKIMRVSSTTAGLSAEPLSCTDMLAAHPRLASWLVDGPEEPATCVRPATRPDSFVENNAAISTQPAGGRKRRRGEESGVFAAAPVPAVLSPVELGALSPLLVPQPGDIVVAVNGSRPFAADTTRQILYGVYQGVSVEEDHEDGARGGIRLPAYVPPVPLCELPMRNNGSPSGAGERVSRSGANDATSAAASASSAALLRRSSRTASESGAVASLSQNAGGVTAATSSNTSGGRLPPPVAPETVLLLYRPPLRRPPPYPSSLLASFSAGAVDAASDKCIAARAPMLHPTAHDISQALAYALLRQPVSTDSLEARYAAAESAARASALRMEGFSRLFCLIQVSYRTPASNTPAFIFPPYVYSHLFPAALSRRSFRCRVLGALLESAPP